MERLLTGRASLALLLLGLACSSVQTPSEKSQGLSPQLNTPPSEASLQLAPTPEWENFVAALDALNPSAPDPSSKTLADEFWQHLNTSVAIPTGSFLTPDSEVILVVAEPETEFGAPAAALLSHHLLGSYLVGADLHGKIHWKGQDIRALMPRPPDPIGTVLDLWNGLGQPWAVLASLESGFGTSTPKCLAWKLTAMLRQAGFSSGLQDLESASPSQALKLDPHHAERMLLKLAAFNPSAGFILLQPYTQEIWPQNDPLEAHERIGQGDVRAFLDDLRAQHGLDYACFLGSKAPQDMIPGFLEELDGLGIWTVAVWNPQTPNHLYLDHPGSGQAGRSTSINWVGVSEWRAGVLDNFSLSQCFQRPDLSNQKVCRQAATMDFVVNATAVEIADPQGGKTHWGELPALSPLSPPSEETLTASSFRFRPAQVDDHAAGVPVVLGWLRYLRQQFFSDAPRDQVSLNKIRELMHGVDRQRPDDPWDWAKFVDPLAWGELPVFLPPDRLPLGSATTSCPIPAVKIIPRPRWTTAAP